MSNSKERIVLVGGGGGVYMIARFLKYFYKNIYTVQTIFDHGGHSGKLRDEHGVLPPGDIRQAMLALSDESTSVPLRALLSYRFPKNGSSIDDATMGNLIFTAFNDIYYGPISAIQVMSRVFGVRGEILPVSLEHAELCAKLSDGSTIVGEGCIDTRPNDDNRKIEKIFLEPKVKIYKGAYDALVKADKIIFCPGDLYTSVVPNILVSGFSEAIRKTKAKLIYITNIVTKKSETHDFKASDFSRIILSHLGVQKFDAVICNDAPIKGEIVSIYAEEGAYPVIVDHEKLSKYTKLIICDKIIDDASKILRHNYKITDIVRRI